MRFVKCHGAGNDFVVVDARELERPWADVAPHMCDRHLGIGSDGIILIVPSSAADLKMRMLNPDGSEAEACGNGLRCFVKYVVDNGLVHSPTFAVETLAGVRQVTAFKGSDGYVDSAEVGMGVPRFDPAQIPAIVLDYEGPVLEMPITAADRSFTVSLVSLGNPHAVTFLTGDVNDYALDVVGPLMEHHAVFPSRVNFEIARVVGREDIDARVWERGAGETLACGSGACAIAVIAHLLGYCDDVVRIHLPGGVVTVTWNGRDNEVLLRGPVKQVFAGEWPE